MIRHWQRAIVGMVAATLIAAGGTGTAQAEIVTIDLAAPGDGLITRDTAAKREWLDITQSTGLNLADALLLTRPGERLAGWRIAGIEQVAGLYRNAVGPMTFAGNGNTSIDVGADQLGALNALIAKLGITFSFPSQNGLVGLVNARASQADPNYQAAVLFVNFIPQQTGLAWFNEGYTSPEYRNYDTGVFLTRAIGGGAVPEPSVWAMMILGFGLAGMALRRRANSKLSAGQSIPKWVSQR